MDECGTETEVKKKEWYKNQSRERKIKKGYHRVFLEMNFIILIF